MTNTSTKTTKKSTYIGLSVAAAITLLVAALVATGAFGAFSSSFTQNQTITAGVVDICGPGDDTCISGVDSTTRLSVAATGVAPNSTVTRYFSLKNTGNLALSGVTGTVAPTGTMTQGLVRLNVYRCIGTYNEAALTDALKCTNWGTPVTNWSSATLASVATAKSLGTTFAANSVTGYKVDVLVGDQTAQSSTLTLAWTLSASQRAANASG